MSNFRAWLRSLMRAVRRTVGTALGSAVTGGARGGPRVAGPPGSPNRASSFHLAWELPARLVEVSAVLEVLVPPRVRSLYFWALQVEFEEDGIIWGGGHTGLQWNPRFPGNTAVNWGGYASPERGGEVLPGSEPAHAVFSGDPNTMAYPWGPGRPYRFRVYRSPQTTGAWRAEVTDLESGETTVVRDLMQPGRAGGGSPNAGGRARSEAGYLRAPIVWSEVFADCDAPSVVVRWSKLTGLTEDGATVFPDVVRANYQSHEQGGCANTSVAVDEGGLLQMTNVPRKIGQGTRLEIPRICSG